MGVEAILNDLIWRGVQLQAEGGNLIVDAPQGVLTSEVCQTLKAHKPELLALLSQEAQGQKVSRSAIPLPTQARQKATLECYATKAMSADTREAVKQELRRQATLEPGERGELTPDLERAIALTQEVFSCPPTPQANDGLSPDTREALCVIRKIMSSERFPDTLAVADAMQVSVTAISGALVELECKRLIHPGDWTRCGTKIRLVTH